MGAGVLGMMYQYMCVFGAPRARFLTDLHATASDFGLIAGLAAFCMAFQFAAGVLANQLSHRKRVLLFGMAAYRLAFARRS